MKVNLSSLSTGLVVLLLFVGVAPIEGQDRSSQSPSVQENQSESGNAPATSAEPGNAPTATEQSRENQNSAVPYSTAAPADHDQRGGSGFSGFWFIIGMIPGALVGYFLGRQTHGPGASRDRAA